MKMTDGQFWCGILILVGFFAAISIGVILHWRALMKAELEEEKKKAWRWAEREAKRMAIEAVKNAHFNVKPVLENETDMNWG